MPGIPTKFVVAEKVLERLLKDDALQARPLKDAANLPFFYLGALGAAFGDLIAARPDVGAGGPNTPYFQVWLPVLSMFAGTPAQAATAATSGVYKDLKQLRDVLNKLDEIVKKAVHGNPAQKDIQKVALIGMQDELKALSAAVTDLQNIIATLRTVRATIASRIFAGGPVPKSPPSKSWQVRDTLHGSHTGRFLREINQLASAGDDPRQKAYALGATIGYATDLCGNPFVNSVVGAPYRNHWWRHRWISNYIDTWVHGYYKLGGGNSVNVPTNGVPNPLYTNWPNVCEANLQKKIELPGLSVDAMFDAIRTNGMVPAVLPSSFVEFWQKAFNTAYGPPDVNSPIANSDNIQSACAMTWLILWIQTSGEAIPCIPGDQIDYPDDCGTRPPWVFVDGSAITGNGTVNAPPAPSRDTDPSVSEVISGIVLGILAVAAWVGGVLVAAVEALIASGAAIADGLTDPDWEELRCYVGWTIAFQHNLTNTLHDVLTWAGLGFPYTLGLTHNDIAFVNTGQVSPLDAALNTARSRGRNNVDPASRWNPTTDPASNWANFPVEAPEKPFEFAYPTPNTWPFHFVDGLQFVPVTAPSPPAPPKQVNPVIAPPGKPPLVRDAAQFVVRQGMLKFPGTIGSFFGNAVDVSLDLILNAKPAEFLDWDLDGDPGIGFPTWQEPSSTSPRTASIPEP